MVLGPTVVASMPSPYQSRKLVGKGHYSFHGTLVNHGVVLPGSQLGSGYTVPKPSFNKAETLKPYEKS